MLIAPKRLKVRTSNLAGVFPGTVPTWPLTNVSKKWAWSWSRDPVHFWALNANSSKMAEGTNFKFDRHVPGIVATWPLTKVSGTLAWPGSRDQDNSSMQTAAMGQIPRSTERILVFCLMPIPSIYFAHLFLSIHWRHFLTPMPPHFYFRFHRDAPTNPAQPMSMGKKEV